MSYGMNEITTIFGYDLRWSEPTSRVINDWIVKNPEHFNYDDYRGRKVDYERYFLQEKFVKYNRDIPYIGDRITDIEPDKLSLSTLNKLLYPQITASIKSASYHCLLRLPSKLRAEIRRRVGQPRVEIMFPC